MGCKILVCGMLGVGLLATALRADEPGHLQNNLDTTLAAPIETRATRGPLLHEQFLNAKGFTRDNIASVLLSVNRVACGRKLFSPSGWSLNGDGDLKSTRVAGALHQLEFPSEVYFEDFNPFRNSVSYYQTMAVRRLMDVSKWVDGDTLKIPKTVLVTYDGPDARTEVARALDEIRIVPETYPPNYIVRETLFTAREFHVYFLCQ